MVTAACSWSSGKDSCLALYKALQQGIQVKYLFNFVSALYQRVSFHGSPRQLVNLQAQALGIELLQRETTEKNYEEIFRNTLRELKEMGIRSVVRGDIHLLDLKDWVQAVCESEGHAVISPLWDRPGKALLQEFVQAGFRAIVTSTQASKLDQRWIGRIVDESFIKEIAVCEGIDPCGENGEYHTFVFDGPIFKKKIALLKTDSLMRDGYWFLDIQKYSIEEKRDL